MRKLMLAIAAMLAATAAYAQDHQEIAKRKMAEHQAMAEHQFVMAERVPLEKSVKGAPYSAEIVVESNQTLADGNRIAHKSTGRVYRDSEGRIRREEDRRDGLVGISIVDSVAGVSYRLDPENHIAWKTSTQIAGAIMNKIEASRVEERNVEEMRKLEIERAARARRPAPPPPPPPPGGVPRVGGPEPPPPAPGEEGNTRPLERRTMEGIAVEGRKSTRTIPAGQIGNEQPITIVSEEWRSPDLDVLVMTHHVDPRIGESTYRLTNIIRAEPDPSLFQVPAGYTVRETRIRREAPNER